MGLQIKDKYTSVRSYCTTRFFNVYEYDSYQSHLRKDQYFMIGMVMILLGVFGSYINLTSMVSSFSAINIPVFAINIIAILVGRESIKRGFDRN